MEHSNAKMPAAANNRRCSSRSHSNRKRGGCFVCCRRFAAFLFSHVGLCGLVVGYSILGAFTFRFLEGPHEVERAGTVIRLRDETVSRLWEITDRYNVLYRDNWTVEVSKEMVHFQQRLIEAVKDGYDGKPNVRRWSLSGAFLYSLTVITTIGYGEIAPRTGLGKVVTILYAIFGIPLMLLYLANIGDILARAFRFTYGKMCTCSRRSPDRQDIPLPAVGYGPHNSGSLHRMNHNSNYASSYRMNHYSAEPPIEKSDVRLHPLDLNLTQAEIDDLEDLNTCRIRSGPVLSSPVLSHAILNATRYSNPSGMDRVSVPISLCLFIMIAYISGGAVLFSLWEDWGFLEAAYFCFVTLSTIGFGDFVPGVSDTDSQEKLVICSLYLLVGMVLIAMCFTLMQEEVVHKVRRLGKRLGLFHKEASCGSCHQLHEVYPPPPPPLPHADLQELTGLTAPIPPPMREPGSDYTW